MCAVKTIYSWLSLSALSFSRENQGSSGSGQGFGEVLCDQDFALTAILNTTYRIKTSKRLTTGPNSWNKPTETQGWMENHGILATADVANPAASAQE